VFSVELVGLFVGKIYLKRWLDIFWKINLLAEKKNNEWGK